MFDGAVDTENITKDAVRLTRSVMYNMASSSDTIWTTSASCLPSCDKPSFHVSNVNQNLTQLHKVIKYLGGKKVLVAKNQKCTREIMMQ